MKAPEHWYQTPGWRARALAPVAAVYAAGARLRTRLTVPQRASVPVVCVGNITAGGSGKTPVAIAIAHRLAARGLRPAFLTRGYGGRLAGPVQVNAETSHAIDVGDEPLLLAQHFTTIVSRDRPKGADAAALAGADIVVMDDGYQNPTLWKDAGVLVVDGASGLGNGHLIPAGPLREPAHDALSRAACLIIMGAGEAGKSVAARADASGVPTLHGVLQPVDDGTRWQGTRVLAFAGIGRPAKFFQTLRSLGADIRETEVFPDHHMYTDDEAQAMLSVAQARGLTLVTTSKDNARLKWSGHSGALAELYKAAQIIQVEVVFDDGDALDQLLMARIQTTSAADAYKAF
ncbi:tetraacyldisaccharide 4'-kinase [Pyruvatibacter sp.]|uniref:tetraacyldisaccharide 4'-kinase n=1 Tax=Pyruvatibacter sp. TaxID=1981328 RepID=UPI0032EB9EA3